MHRFPSLPALLARLAASALAAAPGCVVQHSSCDGYVSNNKDIAVTPDVACAIAAQSGITRSTTYSQGLYGKACNDACGPGFGMCDLPADYVKAYQASLPADDAGAGDAAAGDAGDAGSAGGSTCPAVSGTVKVHCASFPCEGRRTDGVEEPRALDRPGLGAYFAACTYLEAASVHAFARLRTELDAHGAPKSLLDLAWRAERDEIRHTMLVGELARRFGGELEAPGAPTGGVRDLFDIALENAVEGCVRETFGAALACFRAQRAQDASVRAVMQSIARDECEHADLAFRIAAWAEPLLTEDERAAIRTAMRAATEELITNVDDLLDDRERALCGLPTPDERARLAQSIDREVLRAA